MRSVDPHSSADLEALLNRLTHAAEGDFRRDAFTKATVVEALAEARRFEGAVSLAETITWPPWRVMAAGYVVESMARAGRVGEADAFREKILGGPGSPADEALLQGRIVQGLVGRGDVERALERLERMPREGIPFIFEVYPRLVCLDALIRADDPVRAEALMKVIVRGKDRHEKCLAKAWMALGFSAWGDNDRALVLVQQAEKLATVTDLPWPIGVYESIGRSEDARRCLDRWQKSVARVDDKDTFRFQMARAMANLRRYDDALRFASEVETGWMAAKIYGCIAYVMFNAGDMDRFPVVFDEAIVRTEALQGADKVHALSDLAVLMAWVQQLGLSVSCVTPILRASLAVAKVR